MEERELQLDAYRGGSSNCSFHLRPALVTAAEGMRTC